MGQYPQFVLYKLVPSSKPGKTEKLPCDWSTGQLPATGQGGRQIWTTFENVAAVAPLYGDDYGVGFSFAESSPFWFLDIDGCLQADNTWSPTAMEVLAALPNCAIEISQSGRGLHIFGTGVVPDHACKNIPLGLEFYNTGRFVALTGTGAMGDCRTDASAALPGVVSRWFPPTSTTLTTPSDWTDTPCPEWRGPTDDAELVRRMLASRSNPFSGKATVQDLWTGNTEALAKAYSSSTGDAFDRSSADIALATHLSFWTGRNCERIERLMRMSALVRDKYDREDYLRVRTIPAAVGLGGDVYRERELELPQQGVGTIAATASEVTGSTFANLDDQLRLFAGCVYVVSRHQVLVPGGHLVDAARFNAMAPYNRFTYMLDAANEKTTRKAFEALTQSQGLVWPQAQGTCFRPELPPGHITQDGLVNTWWPVETPCEEGDVSPFLQHLAKLLPVKRDRDILINYAAALVQYPGDKFQWWPVIQGVEGNGKTLLLEVLEHCVGQRYSHRPNASEIAGGGGKFTGWLDGKVLVGFEEVKTNHKAEVLEILKPIVTNNRLEIQNKGVDQITKDNRANGIMHSNYKDAIAVALRNRRYAPFFTAQQTEEDLERDGMTGMYFPNLYSWLRRGGGLARLNHFFRTFTLDLDLSPALDNGGRCHRRPITSSLDEAVSVSLGRVEQEVMEAVAECKQGFSGGWISSIELDRLLQERRIDGLVTRTKRPEMLRNLGYVHHPELHGGRATAPTSDGRRPVLYVKLGHLAAQVQGGAAITRAYEAAQLPVVFVDSKVRVVA
jgi:hypothetical protein